MNAFDYAIIGVLALFLLLGLYKGFIKTTIALAAWAAGIALIYFLGDVFGSWLMSVGLGDTLTDSFAGMIKGDAANLVIGSGADGLYLVGTDLTVAEGLSQLGIPSFLHSMIIGLMVPGATLATSIGGGLARYACIAIGSVILLLGVTIIAKIISVALHKTLKRYKLTGINRVIGGILYAGIGFFFVCAAMLLIDAMAGLSFMPPVITMRSEGIISSWFAENNPIKMLIDLIAAKV